MPFRVWMLLALLAVNGCKDESDPVDIPFDGVDPGDVKDTRPKPVVEPTATASASAKPGPGPGNPAAARVRPVADRSTRSPSRPRTRAREP